MSGFGLGEVVDDLKTEAETFTETWRKRPTQQVACSLRGARNLTLFFRGSVILSWTSRKPGQSLNPRACSSTCVVICRRLSHSDRECPIVFSIKRSVSSLRHFRLLSSWSPTIPMAGARLPYSHYGIKMPNYRVSPKFLPNSVIITLVITAPHQAHTGFCPQTLLTSK